MERYRVGFGRTGSMLVMVHRQIWMYHYMWYDTTWHYCNRALTCYSITMTMSNSYALMTSSQLHANLLFLFNHNDNDLLMLIEYMERSHAGCGRTASMLVLVHDWIWMSHYILGVWSTMTPSQLCIIHPGKLAMANGYGLILMAYMEQCRVRVGRTASMLVLVHVGICNCLV